MAETIPPGHFTPNGTMFQLDTVSLAHPDAGPLRSLSSMWGSLGPVV